jgi:TonB family protein
MRFVTVCVVALAVFGQSPSDSFAPARVLSGTVPALPALAVGGGQVFLELDVASDGRVGRVSPLRITPAFTDLVVNAARQWRFEPATKLQPDSDPKKKPLRVPVASKVLVAGVFRPPSIYAMPLGEPPRDVAGASPDGAAVVSVVEPPHAITAHSAGVVLLEASIDARGAITEVAVLQSAPPYDDVAVGTVKKWAFRPARDRDGPVPTKVYVILGFPLPVS